MVWFLRGISRRKERHGQLLRASEAPTFRLVPRCARARLADPGVGQSPRISCSGVQPTHCRVKGSRAISAASSLFAQARHWMRAPGEGSGPRSHTAIRTALNQASTCSRAIAFPAPWCANVHPRRSMRACPAETAVDRGCARCCATVAGMKKEKEAAPGAGAAGLLERIKILAIQAMFSDDDLLEKLVLKGGNAMVLIHRVSARTSVDLDFSLAQDFGDEVAAVRERIERLLQETFAADGFHLFDFEMLDKPKAISEDMRHFWGGYEVVFKLATADLHAAHGKDLNALRRMALNLGKGTRFSIDISRFEYVEDKAALMQASSGPRWRGVPGPMPPRWRLHAMRCGRTRAAR